MEVRQRKLLFPHMPKGQKLFAFDDGFRTGGEGALGISRNELSQNGGGGKKQPVKPD